MALSRFTKGVVGGFFTLNTRIAFDHGCDCPSYVAKVYGRRAGGLSTNDSVLTNGDDVIVQVNDQGVVTRDAAREALADTSAERPLRLTVRRGERRLGLTLIAP